MPSFYLALLLVLIFAINFEILPIAGLHSVPNDGSLNYYLDYAWHLVLPIFIIVFGGIGSLILYIRSLTLEILKSDYIFFAKARGLSQKQILRYYIYYTSWTFTSWNHRRFCNFRDNFFN